MNVNLSTLDRRKFLRGAGVALALPWLESFTGAAQSPGQRKRLACFYLPDGVPMPLEKDPAFRDWSWFPHGKGKDFKLTKCMETLEPLRNELTVFSGLSNPALRRVAMRMPISLSLRRILALMAIITTAFRSTKCLPRTPANTRATPRW